MHYRIDWESLNQLPDAERMAALARMNKHIRSVTGAERGRMAHRAVAAHGTQKDAATHLRVGYPRFKQIIKENPVENITVTITDVAPAELHRQYPGQHEPQDAYVEVGLEQQTLCADYNGEVGNAVPADVYHGQVRRYEIPALTSTAANELLEEIRPLAERMVADWDEKWNGNDMVAVLGDDAAAAEAAIQALCAGPWETSEKVTVWDIDGATNGSEAADHNITATTTDERLDEIEEEIRQVLAGVSDSEEVVLEGIDDYLRQVRDDLAEEADDE